MSRQPSVLSALRVTAAAVEDRWCGTADGGEDPDGFGLGSLCYVNPHGRAPTQGVRVGAIRIL